MMQTFRLIIILLFVAYQSYGQPDTLKQNQLKKLLEDNGWTTTNKRETLSIQFDENGIENFVSFYFNWFITNSDFRINRIRYPLRYSIEGKGIDLDKSSEFKIDSVCTLGDKMMFIYADTTRMIFRQTDSQEIESEFGVFDGRWFLTKIAIRQKEY